MGSPLIIFLLFVGIFLTIRYRFPQLTRFGHAIDLVWLMTDIMNGFMAFPNLVGILGLSGLSVKMISDYFSRPQEPLRSKTYPPYSTKFS